MTKILIQPGIAQKIDVITPEELEAKYQELCDKIEAVEAESDRQAGLLGAQTSEALAAIAALEDGVIIPVEVGELTERVQVLEAQVAACNCGGGDDEEIEGIYPEMLLFPSQYQGLFVLLGETNASGNAPFTWPTQTIANRSIVLHLAGGGTWSNSNAPQYPQLSGVSNINSCDWRYDFEGIGIRVDYNTSDDANISVQALLIRDTGEGKQYSWTVSGGYVETDI